MRKLLVIVNPKSGRRRGKAVVRQVTSLFEEAGIGFETIVTEHAGHAREIVRDENLNMYDGVCVIGGDGTMHEAINGMVTREGGNEIPTGLIPAGTGSSLMHDLDCLDPFEAARRIVEGDTRKIDLMELNMAGRRVYAFNIVGWGLVVDVIRLAEKLRWLGYQRYNAATLKQFVKIPQRGARLIIDDNVQTTETVRYIFIMGCNTRHTGRGMQIAPKAKLEDGLMDLVIVKGSSRRGLMKVFTDVFEGKHLDSPHVNYHQVRSFSIHPEVDDQLNIDGEIVGMTPIEVRVLKQRLEIFR